MSKDDFKLNTAQERAAGAIDKSVAVIAGAGSGKTRVLVERIKRIIEGGHASLSEIVAITFTEKAAGELLFKVIGSLPHKFRADVDLATITTIDGFCAKILREDASTIGINPDFTVLEEHASRLLNHRVVLETLKEMLSANDEDAHLAVNELDFKHALTAIEEMLDNRWHVLNWPEVNGNGREQMIQRALVRCFMRVIEKLDREKKAFSLLDFVDLEINTLKLLSSNEEIRKKHRARIRHLLIDEYQDTSDLQSEIVKLLFEPKRNNLFIVGDPAQSIYRFRGANPDGLFEMKRIIEASGGEVIELTENYRSGSAIVNFANTLFRTNFGTGNYFLPLKARAEWITSAEVIVLDTGEGFKSVGKLREAEAEAIADYIGGKTDQFGDIAILLRSFTDVEIYERALSARNIPCYRSGGQALLSRPEIADIILFLKAISNTSNDTLAFGLARSSIIGLTDDDCYKLMRSKSAPLFDVLAEDARFSYIKDILRVRDFLSVPELIREIVGKTNLFTIFRMATSSSQSTANIEKFIRLAETIDSQYCMTLEEFLNWIDDIKERGIGINEPPIFSPHDNAVKILTVHAAKGLEFKVVILADLARADRGCSSPYIIDKREGMGFKLYKDANPIADKENGERFTKITDETAAKDLLEKERLLYVAVTRACERLILPYSGDIKYTSAWLRLLTPHIGGLRKIKSHPCSYPVSLELVEKQVQFGTPLKSYHRESQANALAALRNRQRTITVSHLESYNRCPQEYFLKYVRGVPAEIIGRRPKGMPANTLGNIVHKIINLIPKSHGTDINQLISAACMEYGYFDPEASDTKKIKTMIERYLASDYEDSKVKNAFYEVPFILRMNNFRIKGTIDCIYKDVGGMVIVDFKTDRIDGKEGFKKKVDEYRLQTLTYAIAAGEAMMERITSMSILFLDTGDVFKKVLTMKDIEEGREWICRLFRSIEEADFDVDGLDTPCMTCPYYKNSCCRGVELRK